MTRLASNNSNGGVLRISVIFWMLVAGGAWASAKPQKNKSENQSAAQTRLSKATQQTMPDLGSVSGNVYTDDFFGITFKFPEGWSVDRAVMDQENASAKRFFANLSNQNESDLMAVHPSYKLLIVSKFPEETRCGECSSTRMHGPSIRLATGAITASVRTQTPAEIQETVKGHLSSKPGFNIIREPANVSFGGQTFSRMDVKNITFQGDAITLRNGYWIEFQITADSAEQLDELFQTLNSLQFKQ